MKRLVITLFICSISLCGFAQIKKGYHGFVDAGYAQELTGTLGISWIELNTVHGYQFNPYIFVGGGLGIHYVPEFKEGDISGKPYWKRDKSQQIPIFANVRWTILDKKITPFIDAKLGFDVTKDTGLYETIGVGCRFGLKNNKAINVKLSYEGRTLEIDNFKSEFNKYTYESYYYYTSSEEHQNNISLTVGFEF
jgi:hypothetical protein